MSYVCDSNLIVKSHLNENGDVMDVTLKNGNRLPKSGLVESIKHGSKYFVDDKSGKLQPVSVSCNKDSKYLRSDPNYKFSDNLLNLPHN